MEIIGNRIIYSCANQQLFNHTNDEDRQFTECNNCISIQEHCDGPQEIGGILETSFYLNCEIYSYCKNVCIKINKKKF